MAQPALDIYVVNHMARYASWGHLNRYVAICASIDEVCGDDYRRAILAQLSSVPRGAPHSITAWELAAFV
jgi:hypothetical protein